MTRHTGADRRSAEQPSAQTCAPVAPGGSSPGNGDVPACGTGPAARAGFVARELADLWRELRGREAKTSTTDKKKEQR